MQSIDIDFKSKVRIFFSVDVIGSTAFKNQKNEDKVQPWIYFFNEFYKGFPVIFSHYAGQAYSKLGTNLLPEEQIPPLFWKSLGDELLFQNTITNRKQVSALVLAFKESIENFNFSKESATFGLSVKGTAWLAGFPIKNAEVVLQNKLDFIGPNMDLGFRLSKFATDSKMIISLSLAKILVHNIDNELTFFYQGKQSLKGILNGIAYPIISVLVKSPNSDSEEIAIENKVTRDALSRYLNKFSKDYGTGRIFILGDSEFGNPPDSYYLDLENFKQQVNENIETDDIKTPPPL